MKGIWSQDYVLNNPAFIKSLLGDWHTDRTPQILPVITPAPTSEARLRSGTVDTSKLARLKQRACHSSDSERMTGRKTTVHIPDSTTVPSGVFALPWLGPTVHIT